MVNAGCPGEPVFLKNAMEERKDLRLIVTSATLDAEKFSAYF